MARNVINKHRNTPSNISYDYFTRGLPRNMSENDKFEHAKGIIVITNKEGQEGLWIVNSNKIPKLVAQPLDTEIPAALTEQIVNLISQYVDDLDIKSYVDEGIEEYNELVVNSGVTMRNEIETNFDTRITDETAQLLEIINNLNTRLETLQEYVDTLEFSDHVLIKENAYEAIRRDHNLVIRIDEDGNWLEEGDDGYETAKEIKYDSEVYYCIPEDGTGPIPDTGSSIDVSGDTIYVYEGGDVVHNEVGDGYTLVLDDSVGINEDTHAIVINIDDSTPESGADIGNDDNIDLDDDSNVSNGNHTLELSNSFTIRPENNELIIL